MEHIVLPEEVVQRLSHAFLYVIPEKLGSFLRD